VMVRLVNALLLLSMVRILLLMESKKNNK